MAQPELELKRWTRVEYERLVERGVFTRADKIELLDGLLIVSEPQSAYHYTTIRMVQHALAQAPARPWIGATNPACMLVPAVRNTGS